MSSANSESLTPLPVWMPFISFCCLIAEFKTSSARLNSNGEGRHLCLVPDHRGKTQFFPIEGDFSSGSFIYGLYDVEVCSIYPNLVEVFLFLFFFLMKNGCCILSSAFSASLDRIIWFLSFLLLMCTTLIDLQILNQTCSPGINPT